MQNSKIEWTDHTFNPWWGCVRVSPGCEHCYAETLSRRVGYAVWGPAKTTPRRAMSASYWQQPLKWNAAAEQVGRRARVFCASMADVFEDHPQVEDWRNDLFELIELTPALDWLLLTKRPENMLTMPPVRWQRGGWPANVVAMTSVEDQRRADERIPYLLRVPARRRGLSCEPLLGPVDALHGYQWARGALRSDYTPPISWIIAGGESGPGARPMHQRWARSLRDQAAAARIAFFFKQHGEWIGMADYDPFVHGFDSSKCESRSLWAGAVGDPDDLPNLHFRVGKKAAGRLLDGRTWDEYPELGVAHA